MLQNNNNNNVLEIFFDDPLATGFQLRELSRKTGIAPPSVKNYLKELEKEGLIIVKPHRLQGFPTYFANRDNEDFKFLKKMNIQRRIRESGLLKYLEDSLLPDVIILFGSAAKGEDVLGSDIDIFVDTDRKKLDLSEYESLLNRKINIFFEKDFKKLSKELKNNILNGIILCGYIKVY